MDAGIPASFCAQAGTVARRGRCTKRGTAVPPPSTKRAPVPLSHDEQEQNGISDKAPNSAAATNGATPVEFVRSHRCVDCDIVWIPYVVGVSLGSIRSFVEPVESSSASTYSEVVDTFVRLLQHRQQQRGSLENPSVLYLDRSWQAWLEDINVPTSHQKLRDAGYKLMEHDMVFIPCLYNQHWILVVMNFDKLEYQVLDSKRKYGYKRILSKLIKGIEQCIVAANGTRKGGIPLDIAKWEIRIIKRLPRQTDETSCGLFMFKYMQLWNGTMLLEKFSQDDIPSIKEEMAVELVFSELNAMAANVRAEIMEWKLNKNSENQDRKRTEACAQMRKRKHTKKHADEEKVAYICWEPWRNLDVG